MKSKKYSLIKKEALINSKLSLEAKGLYCLIASNLNEEVIKLLSDVKTRNDTIKSAKELTAYNYADFRNLNECIKKDSYLSLNITQRR